MHSFSLEIITNASRTAGHYLADRDEKYVIRHQNMRSQGLTGLAGPTAPSEIVLRYAFSTLKNVLILTFPDFSYSS